MDAKKSSFKMSFFSGIIGFFIGVVCLLVWQKYSPIKVFFNSKKVERSFPFSDQSWDPFFDEYLNDQLSLPGANPFEQLEQMRRKSHPFDSWYQRRFGGGSPGDVKRRENPKYIYYDISIKGLDQQNINVEVKEGQVFLKGQVQMEEAGVSITQKFQRSFPVPVGVLSQKVEIEHDQDLLILKFPKVVGE